MEADASLLSLNVGLGVLLVDILLSGDNAIVIALVCRTLSPAHRSKALWLGVLGAFVARLVLTSVASLAMNLPLIKLIGGLLLLKIAIDLMVDNASANGLPIDAERSNADDMFTAAKTIVLADLVMSLDNVVALSAITQNNFPMLVVGLLLSIPILMFGSLYIGRLLTVFPWLIWVGGAMLGGVSGALIIEDPVFGGVFNSASSLANLFVPVLAAVFVVQISRVIAHNASSMRALPKPRTLFDIVWHGRAQWSTAMPQSARDVGPMLSALPAVMATALAATAQPVDAVVSAAPRPAATPQPRGEHRLVIGLGLFMVASGGLMYYMLNAYEPPGPDTLLSYFCKEPALSIRFQPRAKQIRFATPKGTVNATLLEDRIVWDDYREAGARLALEPPVKIILVDAGKLVVNGGMFDNTTCEAAAQR